MRTFSFMALAAMYFMSIVLQSCSRLGDYGPPCSGRLSVSFDSSDEVLTRSSLQLPDTSEFILTVKASAGSVIYKGKLGDCPETMEVSPGSYVVSAVSATFVKPAFSCPQFGDEQCVVVPAGGDVSVKLLCTQMNAGVNLDISPDFLTECPDAVLHLKSAAGKLMYSYSEKRTAYFPPGAVSLLLTDDKGEQILMTRELSPCDMLKIKVAVAEKKAAGISVLLDTSRVWLNEDCLIGGQIGADEHEVLTVAQARASGDREDVWISGYIVGGDLTTASSSFELPFKSRSNLLLGPRSTTFDRDACLAVQLPDGDARRGLNLVDNPDMLGKRVRLKGDIVSAYFGMPGLKNISDYELM